MASSMSGTLCCAVSVSKETIIKDMQARASGYGPVALTRYTSNARRHHRGQHTALPPGSLAGTTISVRPEVLE